jgi:hypothetical protein
MTQLMEPRKKDRKDRHGARLQSVPRPESDAVSTAVKAPVPRWRRIVPALAISAMAGSYVYATVPFTFASTVECRQNGLSGATVAPGTPAGTLIGDVDVRCAETGNSRMAVAGVTAGLAAVVGLAGAFAPTDAEVRARKEGGSGDAGRVAWRARTMPAGARS